MRVVIQRTLEASVTVEGRRVGEIGKGLLLLVGIGEGDTPETAERMADKIARLRIFEDAEGKTNLSLADVGGSLLVVSQFTLYADCRKGNRPSFALAARPEKAREMYEVFLDCCRKRLGEEGRRADGEAGTREPCAEGKEGTRVPCADREEGTNAPCADGEAGSDRSAEGGKVQHGEFGADMKVSLVNDGPFTILLEM